MKKQIKTKEKKTKKRVRFKKRGLEFEFIFSAENNQKIVLQRYAKESMVWWDQGRKRKVWKGDLSICEASRFIEKKWPKHRVIYSNASYNPPPRPTDVYPCPGG